MANADQQGRIGKSLVVGLALMALAYAGAYALVPRHYVADDLPPMDLKGAVPTEFGQWRQDTDIPTVLPDPGLLAAMNQLYSQQLTRTYVNPQGQRIMLSLAYGKDQSSNSTAAHRPEFCYTAQGFTVERLADEQLDVAPQPIPAARLVGTLATRIEPITYWVTLNDTPALPGLSRKIQQLRYGLQGKIVDGMLVRVSSIGGDSKAEFDLQDQFLKEWRAATPDAYKKRFFGS